MLLAGSKLGKKKKNLCSTKHSLQGRVETTGRKKKGRTLCLKGESQGRVWAKTREVWKAPPSGEEKGGSRGNYVNSLFSTSKKKTENEKKDPVLNIGTANQNTTCSNTLKDAI